MSKTAAIPMDKEIQSFQFIFTGQQYFVKIISLKNGNCVLALRKRLFCDAKQPLLPCKTYAFGMQNNRFCKALVMKQLRKRHACEKYLHIPHVLCTYKIRNIAVF